MPESPGGPSDAIITIRVRAACPSCHASGIVLPTLEQVFAANPRSPVPVFIVVGFIAVVMAGYWLLYDLVAPGGRFRVAPIPAFIGLIGPGWCVRRSWRLVRVRALMCSSCRRICSWGFGREIPVTWQETLVPRFECLRCGYSLVGLTQDKCPECGLGFPVEWLRFTSLGQPDAKLTTSIH